VRRADRIVVMDSGMIDGIGTHDELLKTNKIYQDIYHLQMEQGGDFDEKK
jgi:ATP-binding cassette subfamily B protein